MTSLPPDAPNESNDPSAAEQPAQPQQPQYQQPQQPYAQPVSDPASNITLNYWLSVFFTWIPALIFWIIEKDKGNQQATAFHVANLNFSLLRTAVGLAAVILGGIPILGGILAGLLWAGGLVLFVFHILAAVKAADDYRNGAKPDPFIFNIPLIK